ncbi:MAG: hypothetical protein WBB01_00945 [Phormidesmis sp.]
MSVVPSQILYLEHGSSRLYAEAIQVVDTRHLCWTRPTLLIQGLPEGDVNRQAAIFAAVLAPEDSKLKLYDLEGCPDLIWPVLLFRVAYDIDFFSLLIQLKISPDSSTQGSSTVQFNAFIRSFWHAHAGILQPPELSSSDAQ